MRPTIADLIVVVLAAGLTGFAMAQLWLTTPSAATHAVVYVGGKQASSLPLAIDARHSIAGRLGISELETRDGKLRFVASPCTHKVCIRAGWLSRSQEATACLPNRVSVSLEGGAREFDSLAY